MVKMNKSDIVKMRMKRIEKEIRDTPYHKGTEHHIGRLKARLATLRNQEEENAMRKSGGGGGYAVKKQGDATVILIGPPSVGKSTLINRLTNAHSKIAPYAFTTLTVIPGMMKYRDAHIQILDVPGIIAEAEKGKGRGREVLSVARAADLIVIMTDVRHPKVISQIKGSLYENGIRLDARPPEVIIEKKLKGNVVVHSNIKQDLGLDTIKEVASEFGYKNAEITIREKLDMETLIDVFARNRVYVPSISVVNKIDEGNKNQESRFNALDVVRISAQLDLGLGELRDAMWRSLNFVRVYLVRIDAEPSFDNPIVMQVGSTLSDVAKGIGTDFAQGKKKAKIWGKGAKFPGQIVSLTKVIEEGMQVRFV